MTHDRCAARRAAASAAASDAAATIAVCAPCCVCVAAACVAAACVFRAGEEEVAAAERGPLPSAWCATASSAAIPRLSASDCTNDLSSISKRSTAAAMRERNAAPSSTSARFSDVKRVTSSSRERCTSVAPAASCLGGLPPMGVTAAVL